MKCGGPENSPSSDLRLSVPFDLFSHLPEISGEEERTTPQVNMPKSPGLQTRLGLYVAPYFLGGVPHPRSVSQP